MFSSEENLFPELLYYKVNRSQPRPPDVWCVARVIFSYLSQINQRLWLISAVGGLFKLNTKDGGEVGYCFSSRVHNRHLLICACKGVAFLLLPSLRWPPWMWVMRQAPTAGSQGRNSPEDEGQKPAASDCVLPTWLFCSTESEMAREKKPKTKQNETATLLGKKKSEQDVYRYYSSDSPILQKHSSFISG